MSFKEWAESNFAYLYFVVFASAVCAVAFNGVLDCIVRKIKERKNKQD